MALSKDTVLFWLRRHIRHVEADMPDQVELAKQGMSYAERSKRVSEYCEDVATCAQELEALKQAMEIFKRHG